MNRDIPIYNAIRKYLDTDPVPFHMPGHKLGRGFPPEFVKDVAKLDVTEIPGMDNLHSPNGVIKRAQEMAAAVFGADETFFLVNGSTCGIHAIIAAICKPGDTLIAARDCHRSAIGGMMLAGVRPVFIKPGYDKRFGIPTAVKPLDVAKALEENPAAAGVLLTSPNYYGVCSDIAAIAGIVHSSGRILAVDEAHGAHLGFNERLPMRAMDSGADICVQSAHKTLPAFTQGAYLHVKYGAVDVDRLRFYLDLIQTTSPSYIVMAFLDIARAIMEQDGSELLDRLLDNISEFGKSDCFNNGLFLFGENDIINGKLDRTRIVVNVRNTGRTGFETEDIMRTRFGIQPEMANYYTNVFLATVADNKADFDRLADALNRFAYSSGGAAPLPDICDAGFEIPVRVVELKDTMHMKGRMVRLADSAGKTSLRMITPYPPGIPVICPGEMILADTVEYIYRIICSGGIVNGLVNNREIIIME